MNDLPHDLGPPAGMRTAVTALFALGGFVVASWAVRIPDVSTQVGAGHEALGAALLCVSLGALATMRVTGALCERLGSGLVSTVAAVLLCATVLLPGLVHTVPGLGSVLIAFGAATGTLNVAMNSVGVRLEAVTRRPLLPSLHAAFSFGGLGGSVVGGLAASLMSPAPHLLAVAGAGLLCVSTLSRRLIASDAHFRPVRLRDSHDDRPARPLGSIRSQILMLGAIAGCTAYGEGALSDWAALHLSVDLHATPVFAAAGYAAFSLAMACGRLGGPALLDVLGATRLLVVGTLLAAAGMLVTALAPDLAASLLGLVLVGLGLANVFPVAIARAGALAGARGVGLASTVGYGGLLMGPAVIGFLAGHVGLPTALTTVSALALVAAALSLRVTGDERVRLAFLPWSQAEVRARLTTSLGQVGTVVSDASHRHAGSLASLMPDALAQGSDRGASAAGGGTPPSPLRDLDWVLGHRR
jgi:hypothetical protein